MKPGGAMTTPTEENVLTGAKPYITVSASRTFNDRNGNPSILTLVLTVTDAVRLKLEELKGHDKDRAVEVDASLEQVPIGIQFHRQADGSFKTNPNDPQIRNFYNHFIFGGSDNNKIQITIRSID